MCMTINVRWFRITRSNAVASNHLILMTLKLQSEWETCLRHRRLPLQLVVQNHHAVLHWVYWNCWLRKRWPLRYQTASFKTYWLVVATRRWAINWSPGKLPIRLHASYLWLLFLPLLLVYQLSKRYLYLLSMHVYALYMFIHDLASILPAPCILITNSNIYFIVCFMSLFSLFVLVPLDHLILIFCFTYLSRMLLPCCRRINQRSPLM